MARRAMHLHACALPPFAPLLRLLRRQPGTRGADLQGSIPVRSRHSRAAASAPTSLPSLTVPLWVRLGLAPRRMRRIDPLAVHGLFGNGPREAGLTAPPLLRLAALSGIRETVRAIRDFPHQWAFRRQPAEQPRKGVPSGVRGCLSLQNGEKKTQEQRVSMSTLKKGHPRRYFRPFLSWASKCWTRIFLTIHETGRSSSRANFASRPNVFSETRVQIVVG